MSESQVTVPCCKCGRPAVPWGEHEHRVGPGPTGKGMGGAKDMSAIVRVPLCRACHSDLHDERWRLEIRDGGIAVGYDLKGEVLFVRAFEPVAVALNLSSYPEEIVKMRGLMTYISDENLAWYIGQAMVATKMNVLAIGMAADVFRERYGQYGQRWYIRAAEYIKDNNQEGRSIPPRELYRCHAIYREFGDQASSLELMPKTLAAACAESEKPQEAIEFCTDAISEGHVPRVREIREQFGHHSSGLPAEQWEPCPTCQGTGRVRKDL